MNLVHAKSQIGDRNYSFNDGILKNKCKTNSRSYLIQEVVWINKIIWIKVEKVFHKANIVENLLI